MVPKKKRVSKELFQAIVKKGDTLSVPLFIFRYIPSVDAHYAVVAPKGVAKKAVARNKLRRQGYAAINSYPLKPCAAIFFYKKEAKNASYSEIKENVAKILSKIKL